VTDGTDPTILVVDDKENIVELYTVFLSPEYDVRTATSGTEALHEVDETVDVVLLDRRMPDMSGDEVLAKLRDRGLECPVAMVSAVEPDTDIVDKPIDAYRLKPIDKSGLLDLTEELLARADRDSRSRELFGLVSKKAALEAAGQDDSAAYDRLVERLEVLGEDVDVSLAEIEAETGGRDAAGTP